MGRVTGEKNPPHPEPIGHHLAAPPRFHRDQFEPHVVTADGAPHPGLRIELREIHLVGGADHRQTPALPPVDDGDVAPGPFGADEQVALGLTFVVCPQQVR
jgi:hypothetical protein